MSHQSIQKDAETLILRQQILSTIQQAQETEDANVSLSSLSFQSKLYPERHAWIDTEEGLITIDLEDWQDEAEWDNAIARVTVNSDVMAIDLIKDWFTGSNLDRYVNLDKTYGTVSEKTVIAS